MLSRSSHNNPPTLTSAPTHPLSQPPSISSHSPIIPTEVLDIIASHSDTPTRAVLLQLSSWTYNIVGPILYRHIILSRENASNFFMGMARSVHTTQVPKTEDLSLAQDDAHVRGSLSNKPYALRWPDIDVRLDDEDIPGPTERPDLMADTYFPTRITHQRKLALLSHVKHITIASIPHTEFSSDMLAWSGIPKTRSVEGTRLGEVMIFPESSTVCFERKAVWQLIDWKDRHATPLSPEGHPFITALTFSGGFDHYCFTFPTFDEIDYQSYLSGRLNGFEKYLDKARLQQRLECYRRVFEKLSRKGSEVLEKIIRTDTRTVTFHEFGKGEIPFGGSNLRVFLAESSTGKEILLPDRVGFQLKRLALICQNSRSREGCERTAKWLNDQSFFLELISPAPRVLRSDSAKDEDFWAGLASGKLSGDKSWKEAEVVKVNWQEAEDCVSCGRKEGK